MTPLPDLPAAKAADVPRDTERRRTWIITELKKRGLSLNALSLRDGYSRNYYHAALYRPLAPGEEAIAAALGLKPEKLWYERYDRSGRRLCITRAKPRPTKDNAGAAARNDKGMEAA